MFKIKDTRDTEIKNDLAEEARKTLTEGVFSKKDKVIKETISKKIGKNWTYDDIKKRGEFLVLQDGSEKFLFDGVELIQFFLDERTIVTKDLSTTLTITQKYKIL
jgi:hypothetical protein